MDSLLVLLIIWAIGKAFGGKKKKRSSINQRIKSVPVQKDPYEEQAKQKPVMGEAIQARKQALQAQYADKRAVYKQADTHERSIAKPQPAVTVGSFGISPIVPLEGVDPCHDEMYQGNQLRATDDVQDAPEWKLNAAFDRQQLVQAVVMQEILTRPCQRQRRGLH